MVRDDDNNNQGNICSTEPFVYYDTCCDYTACIDYLRTARKNLFAAEAELEYHATIATARTESNCYRKKPNRIWVVS